MMISLLFLAMPPLPAQAAGRLQDVGDKLVVVIDPGHGGENLGTIENGHEEKSMTMVTALAMYEELSLYDDVEVYLTRTGDADLSLQERAEFAASVNADFLFSIHYNASVNHDLFGAEVWVSAFAPFNSYGYQFGYELLSDLSETGLLIRGVKTRLNDSGKNYYGIIRQSEDLGVPAAIIEHCHVDEARDEGYCDSNEKLREFGRKDATAAARYFGLKSSALGVDYSGYSLTPAESSVPVPITLRDGTEPDICQIEPVSADYETGFLSLNVTAADYDSPLLYYSYSLDGGQTYSAREAWPQADTLRGGYADTFTLNLQIPLGTTPTVIFRAYNMFDVYTDSAPYISPQAFQDPSLAEAEEAVEAMGQAGTEDELQEMTVDTVGEGDAEGTGRMSAGDHLQEDTDSFIIVGNTGGKSDEEEGGSPDVSFLTFLEICLVAVIFLFILLLISQTIAFARRRKRRRQRRNDSGIIQNQPR